MQSPSLEEILESVLNGYQLRVEVIADVRYCDSWYENEPASARGQFHLLGEGECLLSARTMTTPVHLQAGDLAILPRGTPHRLASLPPGNGPSCEFTSMLCGELDFAMGLNNPVLLALPDCLVVRSRDSGGALHHLAGLLLETARSQRLGRKVVMNKLADSLFTQAICDYAQTAEDPRGLFAALGDPRMARALGALHSRCGEDWTLQGLAEIAGMSRSAFAQRFNELMGTPPMHYLSSWRVAEARRLLQDRRLSVASVAERLGYRSEAAFRKLFKRLEGIGPGKVRADALQGAVRQEDEV